jgi:ABC-type glycerol-3-phosphate transport system substrate-binding protein
VTFKSDAAQEVKNTPYYSVFAKQLLTSRIRANSPGYSQLDTDWSNELQQVLAGTVTVSAGLSTAAQEANTALAGS